MERRMCDHTHVNLVERQKTQHFSFVGMVWNAAYFVLAGKRCPRNGYSAPGVCLSECQLAFHSGVPQLKYLGAMPEHRPGCIISTGGFIPQPLCKSDVSGTSVPPQGYTGRNANWRPTRGVLQPLNRGRQSTRGQCPNTIFFYSDSKLFLIKYDVSLETLFSRKDNAPRKSIPPQGYTDRSAIWRSTQGSPAAK